MKLMILDDEPVIVRGLSKLLDYRSLGFDTVLEATDSTQALALLEQSPPDVLLSDIVMPGYSGIDLLRYLHGAGPDTKVIFLSGHQDFHYAREAISLGAMDYLLKPVEQSKLEALLRRSGEELSQNREKDALHRKVRGYTERKLPIDPLSQWSAMENKTAAEDHTWYCLLGIRASNVHKWSVIEESLFRFSLYNKAESYAQAHGGTAFVKDDHLVVILSAENPERSRRLAEELSQGIAAHVLRLYEEILEYTVGLPFQNMQSIPEKHQHLVSLMETNQAVIPNEPSAIDKVKEHILSHYHQNLSLEIMASIACVHPTYFSAYFRRHTGMGFKAYLTQVRIQAAQQLLRNGDLKVYEVANRVGFSDPRHFSDIFRKTTGLTPQQYKDLHGISTE